MCLYKAMVFMEIIFKIDFISFELFVLMSVYSNNEVMLFCSYFLVTRCVSSYTLIFSYL